MVGMYMNSNWCFKKVCLDLRHCIRYEIGKKHRPKSQMIIVPRKDLLNSQAKKKFFGQKKKILFYARNLR